MLHRIGAALVVPLALACVSPQAWAGKVGPEFRVNNFTKYILYQEAHPSVAGLSNGGFVVTWLSRGDGFRFGIYGQRYSAAGARVGAEFWVNTFRTNDQTEPSVAGLGGGGFVVTWTSWDQDGSGGGVYGQRYNALGARVGGEFRVNTTTADFQWRPSIAALNDGGFVVAWSSWGGQDGSGSGVYGQRYSAAGVRAGGEFRVNTFTAGNQDLPSVAGLGGGGFVVTWTSYGQDGSGGGVYGQRYSAAGVRDGGEFRVNSYTARGQVQPFVAGLSNGGFVVTWTSADQDGSSYGVYGQRYSAAGARAGSEFRVNTTTAGYQWFPSVAALNDGGFVVTWQSLVQDGSYGDVSGQRYSAAGARIGGQFRVNTYTANTQDNPAVAGLSNGGFVVTWSSLYQDGSDWGVYGQRFSP